MPTYWKSSQLSHPADSTIHAGKTRITLQDNLRCVAENSGYDYDITIRDLPLVETIGDTWAWLTEVDQFPLPVWRNHGNEEWRAYQFDILAESDSLNDIQLRVFLLKNRTHPAIDTVTGDVSVVGGVSTSYKEFNIGAPLTRYVETIKFTAADSSSARAVTMDQVWVHIAACGITPLPAGDDLSIYAMNVKEST